MNTTQKTIENEIFSIIFSGGEPSVHNINDWKSLVSLIKKHLDVRIKIDTKFFS